MMRQTIACLLALFAAGTANCLEVTPANPVPAYSLVMVKLDDGERAWVLGENFLPVEVAKTENGLVFTGPPGRYAVLAFTTTSQDQAIVQIGGSTPDPDPDPGPSPAGPWRIVMFYDAENLDNMTREQQSMLRGEAIKADLEGLGHELLQRVEGDPATYPTAIRDFVIGARGHPRPRVAVQLVGGGIVLHFPLPATREGLLLALENPSLTKRAKR